MCYGACPLEHYWTGECRGGIDMRSPDAACRDEDAPEAETFEPEYEHKDRLEDE